MTPAARSLGDYLREWRQRRRMSQLDLALEAEISQRHLSFIESGRATPSREMLLHLAERLEVPLRERNPLLLAAGFAPIFAERKLDDPALEAARRAVDMVLKGHEPFPALAVDRHWTLVTANAAIARLLSGIVDQSLLTPPVNVLRISLHPQGLASHIVNHSEWRSHLLDRLRQQIAASGDPILETLLKELRSYPVSERPGENHPDYAGIAVPLRLSTKAGLLSLISTTTVFGTPVDITLSELAVESFFPADEETAAILRSQGSADGFKTPRPPGP
ncbi:helix-turn-helix domain-containing protein [Rhizobium bangladeshense]|uniref:helix-turn-helix domain-containing protein n=1 Tax=Rhizobium bangladeshense TaxID=1138189 RepID=UPI001A98D91D|nr:helix-turn-helix transcriptional regulator [Rhizobium bangladeshense]MBX4930744.1 helix-turn-helix transcriptional regulator [Rhizobium bangladeshense]MBY3580955.1 helix-turn-helix transcriptional regulator [Rhizobium bangladeshense]QSY87047.1 helix-turn-helix transcriptional regulator [Rhizobium bangladeshense]